MDELENEIDDLTQQLAELEGGSSINGQQQQQQQQQHSSSLLATACADRAAPLPLRPWCAIAARSTN